MHDETQQRMKVADLAQILLKPSDSYTYQETKIRYDVGLHADQVRPFLHPTCIFSDHRLVRSQNVSLIPTVQNAAGYIDEAPTRPPIEMGHTETRSTRLGHA